MGISPCQSGGIAQGVPVRNFLKIVRAVFYYKIKPISSEFFFLLKRGLIFKNSLQCICDDLAYYVIPVEYFSFQRCLQTDIKHFFNLTYIIFLIDIKVKKCFVTLFSLEDKETNISTKMSKPTFHNHHTSYLLLFTIK